jgi:hypothetical protein
MDKKTGTWNMPYGKRANPKGYPGTMLINFDAPTSGLTKQTADDLGQLMTFAGTSGQIGGSQLGELPAGYLPLTKANGLEAEAAYTVRAAQAVTDQTGKVPSLVPPPPAKPTPSPTPTPTSTSGSAPTPTPTTVASSPAPVTSSTPTHSATSSPSPTTQVSVTPQASVSTPGQSTGVGGLVIPGLAVLGIAALASAGLSSRRARKNGP